jgi:hypothetical protein
MGSQPSSLRRQSSATTARKTYPGFTVRAKKGTQPLHRPSAMSDAQCNNGRVNRCPRRNGIRMRKVSSTIDSSCIPSMSVVRGTAVPECRLSAPVDSDDRSANDSLQGTRQSTKHGLQLRLKINVYRSLDNAAVRLLSQCPADLRYGVHVHDADEFRRIQCLGYQRAFRSPYDVPSIVVSFAS